MKKSNFKNKWNIFKENNPTAHVCVLIIVINLVFISLSALLISILPENRGNDIGKIVRSAFTLMVNPSGKYTYGETPISNVLTTIVVLLGMISLTGGTVGFITSLINGIVEKSAKNKKQLSLKDHIVILNYNNKVPSLILDYSFDDMDNTFIVILTEKDEQKVIDEIDLMYDRFEKNKKFKNLIVREGDPMSKLTLDKLNIKDAQTVILMEPETNSMFEASKQFMFVTWYFSNLEEKSAANIVVESGNTIVQKMVSDYQMEKDSQTSVCVNYNEITGKIMALTSLMPATNIVLKQLFSFEGVEIYLKDNNGEMSIEDELLKTRSAIPLFDQDGKRVYVAEDEDQVGVRSSSFVLSKPLPEKPIVPNVSFEKSNIIIIGVNEKLPYILEGLNCFKEEYENDDMTVILAGTADEEESLKEYYQAGMYKSLLNSDEKKYIIVNDIYNPIEELGPLTETEESTIIFLSGDDASDANIDERPLMYWSNLKKSLWNNDSIDVIVEIIDTRNKALIELHNKDQIVVSDEFLGHLYAQLGKNPLRIDVIKDMVTSEGDSSSVNINQVEQNEGDLVCISCAKFFNNMEDLSFSSKREFIVWVFLATGRKALPLGIVRDNVEYIFARTDGENDDLDSVAMLGSKAGQLYETGEKSIVLRPEDDIIAIMM